MEDHLAVFLIALAVLVSASVSDWRRREAGDIHWAILMAMGCVLFALRLIDADAAPAAYLSVVSMALMAVDLLWDRDTDARIDLALYVSIIVTTVVSAFALRDTDLLWTYVSMPVMYLVMNTFYYTGIVKGGADAKAIISVAFVYPSYPVFGDIPLIDIPSGTVPQLMVPAFAVFMLAAILSLLLVIPYMVTNIVKHDTEFPMMMAGFRMDIDRAERSHVWPMEDAYGSEVTVCMSGTEDPDVYRRLREAGRTEVWVTPIIPFLIPITIAYAAILLLGNPLFLLI
jgi:preflagellin peptidase FlaK